MKHVVKFANATASFKSYHWSGVRGSRLRNPAVCHILSNGETGPWESPGVAILKHQHEGQYIVDVHCARKHECTGAMVYTHVYYQEMGAPERREPGSGSKSFAQSPRNRLLEALPGLPKLRSEYDVLVVGGGNAALCAALSASESGSQVLIVETAPLELRGGNSRHTRNMRCMHSNPTEIQPGVYTESEYLDDLLNVTSGQTDEALARLIIRSSLECTDWMRGYGVRFQPSLDGTLHLSCTNAFFLGGGKALLNAYYQVAERRGIRILYNAEVTDLNLRNGVFESATVIWNGSPVEVRAKAVVFASGGFESNLEWLKEAWGEAANHFLIRGTRFNTGKVLRLLLENGTQPVGDCTQCHAVAIDARAPKFDGGIVTRLDCLPLGIVVNQCGERFYDEGEELWPKRYAIWGSLVAQQSGQLAYSITDSKVTGLFMPTAFPPIRANTIRELAARLSLSADILEGTIARYNGSVQPGDFDHKSLDSCRTVGLWPSKSHWAQTIDKPPFAAYPLRPGITFTYLGVKISEKAQVLTRAGCPSTNMFAAGEIIAGNVLGKGYLAGIGMTIGTVMGRIAGREAAYAAS
jgi:tricarballylate dehydrogenase